MPCFTSANLPTTLPLSLRDRASQPCLTLTSRPRAYLYIPRLTFPFVSRLKLIRRFRPLFLPSPCPPILFSLPTLIHLLHSFSLSSFPRLTFSSTPPIYFPLLSSLNFLRSSLFPVLTSTYVLTSPSFSQPSLPAPSFPPSPATLFLRSFTHSLGIPSFSPSPILSLALDLSPLIFSVLTSPLPSLS